MVSSGVKNSSATVAETISSNLSANAKTLSGLIVMPAATASSTMYGIASAREGTTMVRAIANACRAGIGRTGTMTVCLLMMLGMEPQAALAHVAAHRPMAGPEVGAQREQLHEPACGVRRSEIAHETGADCQTTRFEPGQAESFLDQLGGCMLGAAELRMGVEVSSQSDEAFAVFVQPLSQ